MKSFEKMADSGNLSEPLNLWFQIKPIEELYDVVKDPHCIKNLAEEKLYMPQLKFHRQKLQKHLKKYKDMSTMPEAKMIEKMWPDGIQPKTATPTIKYNSVSKNVTVKCSTKGSSIVYLESEELIDNFDRNLNWKLYNNKIDVSSNRYYYFVSERIGYETSEMAILQL